MTDSTAPLTLGVHHLGLTVPNVSETAEFLVDALGFNSLGGNPDYPAVFLSDGTTMLTLWQVAEPQNCVAFDRRRHVGLHHFALGVADQDALNKVYRRLSARSDVQVEFAPEAMTGTPLQHMMCTIPGGLRVEFVAG